MPRITGDHSELLERFLATRDQSAFSELAAAHLGLVYSAALRVTRAPDLAEEVAQTVMIKLASLSHALPPGVTLNVWLHRVTRSMAIDLVRSETRRRQRENVAATFADKTTTSGDGPEFPWDQISPVIDEVIGQLPARDRELILSRFFTGCSHGAMARALGLTEDAVRMRLKRAMDKMRVLLERRGIATSAALLALCLPAHAASPVPPLLMAQIPRMTLPPSTRFFLWLRALFPTRLAGPFQAVALATAVLAAMAIRLRPHESASVSEMEAATQPAPPPALPQNPSDPGQDPGFEDETASRFGDPPRRLLSTPPDDSEIPFYGPRLEVILRPGTADPRRFSA
ncbi:RNA polymerase sigma factor [Luteolibacter sp. Populi]|uniref:RNA polymerase sigma factor n=1 Tax=Luteolibacter sp. Populi TaxID=3230487 RepID=UPI00346588C3